MYGGRFGAQLAAPNATMQTLRSDCDAVASTSANIQRIVKRMPPHLLIYHLGRQMVMRLTEEP